MEDKTTMETKEEGMKSSFLVQYMDNMRQRNKMVLEDGAFRNGNSPILKHHGHGLGL